MLSKKDIAFIKSNGYLWDHCWRFFSLIAGEPFLTHGCIYHFDGTNLYFDGFPVDRRIINEQDLVKKVDDLVITLKPKLIWYSGPVKIDRAIFVDKLRLAHTYKPDLTDVSMSIDLDTFLLNENRKRKGWINKSERNHYRLNVPHDKIFGVQHIEIIQQFVQKTQIGAFARTAISRLGDFSRLDDVILIEVWDKDSLIGFGVVESWFNTTDVFIYGFRRYDVPGAGDALQWAIIQSSISRGKKILCLGYSLSESLYKFKTKWGATPSNQGYYDQLWYEDEDYLRKGYCHWTSKLLSDISCSTIGLPEN